MAAPYIASKAALKTYIIRQLGGDAMNIELSDDNLEDAIVNALDDYLPVAYSGVVERYIPIQLLEGVQEYILPYSVFAVHSVNDVNMLGIGGAAASNMFSLNQFIAADLYKPGTGKIDIAGYESINQMIETMQLIFGRKITFDFNSISKVLYLHGTVTENAKAVIQIFSKLDLEGTPEASGTRYHEENIYNEKWIKAMSVARAMRQWGINIGLKYSGSVLPQGGSLNGTGILERADKEIETLSTDLKENYTLPPDFFVGVFVLCTVVGFVWNALQASYTLLT